MNIVSLIMAIFAAIAAVDLIIGNKLGLGGEFEKGINMLGNLTLSMLGMIVLSPLISNLLSYPLKAFSEIIPIDPSAFISSILANDMGGAQVSKEIANSEAVGYFNGLIVGSMMGATISFTLPFVMGAVDKEQRKNVLLGLLCGICTIPVGCFVAGLMVGISPLTVLLNLLPLILLSVILAVGLLLFRNASVKIFNVFGIIIRTVVIAGLVVGILEYLLGIDILPYTAPETTLEGVEIIFNIACVMAGAFPLLYIISKLVAKPLSALGKKTGINEKRHHLWYDEGNGRQRCRPQLGICRQRGVYPCRPSGIYAFIQSRLSWSCYRRQAAFGYPCCHSCGNNIQKAD